MACADGFPSNKWIDIEDPILFPVQFRQRHTPTRTAVQSLARGGELAKSFSLASYVGNT